MNKIFKIVFNAARGKMMVVNETTSSVQTGKKAAVTVAVISALASGVAMAADINIDQTTFSNKGGVNWTAEDNVTINTSDTGYYGVFGYSGDVNVKDLTINSQSGGINLQAQSGAPTTDLTINADNVTINAKKYSAVYNGDANSGSTVTLNVKDKLEINAPQIAVTGGDKNLVINAGSVSADLTGNGMVSYGTIEMNAGSIDIAAEGKYLTWSHKNIILNATDGDLNLTGNIFNDVGAVETSLSGKNITLNGDIISQGGGTTTKISSEGDAKINGSVTLTKGDSLNIKTGSTTIDGKVTQENGRTTVAKDAQLTITSGEFNGNTADASGGAIYALGDTTLDNAQFLNNSAAMGGAIFAKGDLTIEDSTFTGSSASWSGAIDAYGDTTISNTAFEKNSAKNHGGAIYNNAGATLSITDGTTFSENKAKYGGAITNESTANIIASTNGAISFTGNEATNSGGAIFNDGKGQLALQNVKFSDNSAGSAGGAIYSNGAVTAQGGEFSNNSAVGSGGAIFGAGSLNVSNATFNENTSEDFGGAVAVLKGLVAEGVKFESNSAYSGGAIADFSNSTGTMEIKGGSVFSQNSAVGEGGAISVLNNLAVTDSEFNENEVLGSGGAIAIGSSATVEIENGQFVGNLAGEYGGAIMTRHGDECSDNSNAKLTISGSNFEGNSASKDGGALHNSFKDTLVESSIFDGNHAGQDGGAIYSHKYAGNDTWTRASMTVKDSTFTNNTAENQGGAIYNTGTLTLLGTNTFKDNVANGEGNDIYNAGTLNVDGKTTIGSGLVNEGTLKLFDKTELVIGGDSTIGGTFQTGKGSVVTLENGATVSLSNKASASDSVNDGLIKNLVIQGDGNVDMTTDRGVALGYGTNTIDANSVTIDLQSGGKAITAYGENTVKADTITITSQGDGIHAMGDAEGFVNLTGNTISIAGGVGGYAIQNASDTKKDNVVVTGKDVTLTSDGRTAVSQQGAGSTVITAENLVIEGFKEGYDSKTNAVNVAAGTLTLTGSDTVVISNGQGGDKTNAIGIEAGATMNVTGGDITVNGKTNVAGDLFADAENLALDNVNVLGTGSMTVAGATVTVDGDFVNSGTTNLSDGATLVGSSAANYGGAIYNNGTLNVDGAAFEENTVKNDGYAYGGAIYNTASGTVNIENGSFVGNGVESSYKPRGGAIDNAGAVTITGTVFEGNFATNTTEGSTDAMGGALYNRGSGTYTITDSKFIGNMSSGEGGALSTNGGLVQFKGENEFLNNVAGKNGGAVDVQGGKEVTFEGKNTFVGNVAGANGGAINIFADAKVTLSGEAFFDDNVAAQGNDIYNAGTLNVDGKVTLGSGMVNDGTLKLSGTTEMVIGSDSTIGGTFQTAKGSVVTLEDGATVALSSKAGDSVNDGVIANLTIQGDGNVDITTDRGVALGWGTNTIDANSVTIDLQSGGKAITAYGENTVKADTITITSQGDGIHAMGDAEGFVNLTGNTISIAGGVGGYAIQNASDIKKDNVVVVGKDVTLTSDGRTAVSQQGAGSTVITAENLVIEGFKEGYDSKTNAVNVAAGTLTLTGSDTVVISNGHGGDKTNAIGIEAAGTMSVTGGDITVNGMTEVAGALTMNGQTVTLEDVGVFGGQLDVTGTTNTVGDLVVGGASVVSFTGNNTLASLTTVFEPTARMFALRSATPVINFKGNTTIEGVTNVDTLNVNGTMVHEDNVNVDNYNATNATITFVGDENTIGNFNYEGGVLNLVDGAQVDVGNMDGLGGTVNIAMLDGMVDVPFNIDGLDADTKLEVNLMNGDLTQKLTADDVTPEQVAAILQGMGGGDNVTTEIKEGLYNDAISANGQAVTTKTNSTMSNVLDLYSNGTLSMNRIALNDVRKRMGDLRAAEGTHGVWARYNGGKLSGQRGFENEFTTIQVGMDTVPVADAPRFGVAFSYTDSDADMKHGGAEMNAYSLAFYGTKMYDNGMFVDVIGRMAKADTDVTLNINGQKTGAVSNLALSLSGELGWRFDVTDKFYFEPQAELTYTYVNADTLKLTGGSAYHFDSVDSLMGRVGFAAGLKCPSNMGDVYVRASAVHEFLGDSAVTGANGTTLNMSGDETWVEFGIGANFNVNKNTYVYVDIERTEGAKLEEDWRANVGVRYSF